MKFFLRISILLCLFSFSATTIAQNLNDELPLNKDFKVGTLSNGITYFIKNNKKPENRVELRLVVNAGSILEEADQKGLAHFVEHMCFNGTKNFPGNSVVDFLESIGMEFGPDINAYTSFDETVYMLQLPADSLEILKKGFLILSDWAHNVTFDPAEIDKERGVVIEEWRLGRGAEARINDKQIPVIFHKSRYAERLPIGTKESLETFKHERLTDFYKTWYRPELMAVVVVGDIPANQAQALIEEYFGVIQSSVTATYPERKFYNIPGHKDTLISIEKDKELTGTSIQILTKLSANRFNTVEDYRKRILNEFYTSMLNQRLYELSQLPEPPFKYAASGYYNYTKDLDFFGAGLSAEDNKAMTGLQTLLEEFERVKKFGFTEAEFDRALRQNIANMQNYYSEKEKLESSYWVNGPTGYFLKGDKFLDPDTEYGVFNQILPMITHDDINKLSARYFIDSNLVVLVSYPDKAGISDITPQMVRDVFRKSGKAEIAEYTEENNDKPLVPGNPAGKGIKSDESIAGTELKKLTLNNGAAVYYRKTDFKNDEVVFYAFSKGGLSLADSSVYKSAQVASSVINRSGLGDFTEIQLTKKLAGSIVSVSPWINSYYEGFYGSSSVNDLGKLFQLIHLYFTSPRNDKDAFSSFMTKLKSNLENRGVDPGQIFSDTITVVMSGYSPYSYPLTVKDIPAIKADECYSFFRERFSDVSDFNFLLVGSFSEDSLKLFADKYLGSLASTNTKENFRNLGIRSPEGEIKKTVVKGLEEQASLSIFIPGTFKYSVDEEYYLNALGQALDIHFRELIREGEGGAYSPSVSVSTQKYPDTRFYFNISFGTDPDKIEYYVNLIKAELNKLKDSGIESVLAAKVKEINLKSRETALKDNGQLTRIYLGYLMDDESLSNINKFNEVINSATETKLSDVMRKYINTDNFIVFELLPEKK
ncbi:MAG: insulinase family protein [Ignavibacteriaceae bacterium]|nr:insulinase family protein [Ignavibacteriaceae bacterium]